MPNSPKLIKVDALTYACNVCPKWEVHINAKKKLNAGQIAREIAKREAQHINEAHSPKVGDPVVRHDSPVVYVITGVNQAKNTADMKTTKGVIILYRDVPWSDLIVLDESQNAARIVREATE